MANHDRGKNGAFVANPDTAERDAEACRLRSRGAGYQEICDALGFTNTGNAHRAVQRALKATMQEPAEDLRRLELDRLDRMWRAAEASLERQHVAISQGRIVKRKMPILDSAGQQVMDPHTGEPMYQLEEVLDDGPMLAALDRLLKIQERRARLLGLDAPSKSRVEVVTTDQITAEIERLEREIAEQQRELADGRGAV
jgi:hypothetical protein